MPSKFQVGIARRSVLCAVIRSICTIHLANESII